MTDPLKMFDMALRPKRRRHARASLIGGLIAAVSAGVLTYYALDAGPQPAVVDTTYRGLDMRLTMPMPSDTRYRDLITRVHEKTGVAHYVLQAVVDQQYMMEWYEGMYSPSNVVYTTRSWLGLTGAALRDDELALTRTALIFKDAERQVGERAALIVLFSNDALRVEGGKMVANPERPTRFALQDSSASCYALFRKGEPIDQEGAK